MTKRTIVENIFSNWANLVVTVVISFLVSPVVVHSLGNELYGVWTVVGSVTGYFTVLDFGVNTAIVRYISRSVARQEHEEACRVYSTSMALFAIVAAFLIGFSLVFGFFFQTIFKLYHIPRIYLYAVFLLSALDLAGGLVFSVFLGALSGLQEFKFINATAIAVSMVRSVLLVVLLKNGYSLFTLALLQLLATLGRSYYQYRRLSTGYPFLSFRRDMVTRETVRRIYGYSIYSFVIAIALKLLFYTDSVVIGSLIGVSEVTFYAIPSTLLDYLEKFVWAMIAVLVPVISANEASGEGRGNPHLYLAGTRFSVLVSCPIVISLYFFGGEFMHLWMGAQIAEKSLPVMRLLLIGFSLANSQLIAHGILKGISRHRALAFILAAEALANLGMSLALARPYGIEGVAFGTMVPLVVASLAIIVYTCRLLQINVLSYLARAYSGGVAGGVAAVACARLLDGSATSYAAVLLKSGVVSIAFLAGALPFAVAREERDTLLRQLRKVAFPVS